MTGRHRALDTLSHRIDRAANIVPEVLDHLGEQRAAVIVLSAQTIDGSPPARGSHADPTLRVALELDLLDYHRRAVDDAIATLNTCVNMLDDACRTALAARAPSSLDDSTPPAERAPVPRCIGDDTPAGATCEQIPVPRTNLHTNSRVDDGRCLDCGPRHDAAMAQAEAARMKHAKERRARRYAEQ